MNLKLLDTLFDALTQSLDSPPPSFFLCIFNHSGQYVVRRGVKFLCSFIITQKVRNIVEIAENDKNTFVNDRWLDFHAHIFFLGWCSCTLSSAQIWQRVP